MCTLIALHRCVPGAFLLVAANRDEFLERPTETPALRPAPATDDSQRVPPRYVAPRDLRAGGTWLGVSAGGLFAAVTNRSTDAPDPTRRSRGSLVPDALAAPTAREAAKRAEALGAAVHNPFNLFIADAETAHLISYDERPERFDLAPGAHVIGNAHPEHPSGKIERLRREVAELGPDPSLGALAGVCRSHADGTPFEATCVHAGEYGTRSSTLLRIGRKPFLHHADGPPCEHPYRDLTPLLRELGMRPVAEAQPHTRSHR